ncbi:MAG: glutamate-1-semialdehyde 2,1-aminomutase [Acidobacteriota bacterium]|nr:glutamate-1-semialdehyde 2,1-aminomutase [Acidobacteriota bacterium]MDE3043213.1 glutamate-1-semialdehyde 2,1-aminomutase [Acidobacteriota bacterium]MDE3106535.1 glutamate-1-semialdehyde 2,1-aminomutase [Acidobacteriota bacterium]MDE3222623.1 glutamate-1-semialdehyde 2,1-aminomutase [Acidobacteriota bacterium]
MTTSNQAWFDRALTVIPGGVDSPVRSFRSVGGTPYTVTRGEGAYVVDVEGRRYLDFVQSYGASILGHAHPAVVSALREGAALGTTFGAPTPGEVLLAEAIIERVTSAEQVRLVSSGTEAVMSAVRLARGHTSRSRILKFDGCYHGHSDALLVAGGSGVAQLGLPGSAGVTAGAIADTVVAPYNVVPTLDESYAAVLVEPVAANMNLVAPAPGFLEGLRAECDRVGALLIFDEVITGFRLALGGAEAYFGVTPDLWCFGKVIGGGLPVGAFASTRAIFASLAPNGPVYQAGTLSGNPLATAAGTTVLSLVGESDVAALSARVDAFADALAATIRDAGLFAVTPRVGPLLGLYLARDEAPAPTNFTEAKVLCDNGLYRPFFHAMLDQGVALAPGAYEIMFVSLAHGERELDQALEAAHHAAVVARRT